ncbi:MAG: hypothetical protein R3324_21560, partial [Halobacteriales archaeon]|nr:hypothetical protein [Halobacteriales archaeon]
MYAPLDPAAVSSCPHIYPTHGPIGGHINHEQLTTPPPQATRMSDFSNRVEKVSISGIREVFEAAGEDAIN